MAHDYNRIRRCSGHWAAAAALSMSAWLITPAWSATPQQVDAAVDKAVAHILSQQKANGSWEQGDRGKGKGNAERQQWTHFGGETAAATYALLAAGVSPQTPALKKALEWLETNDAHGTYVVGLRAGVWSQLPEQWRAKDKVFVAVRDHDRDFALYSRIPRGPNMGFYSYVYGAGASGSMNAAGGFAPYDKRGPVEGAHYDRSNSQYGVFAAWGTEQAGAEIPTQYWAEEDTAWKKAQLSDGGWDYRGKGDAKVDKGPTYTMTCAGLATLFITQDYVLRSNAHQFDLCKGGVTNANIEKGLAWLDKHIANSIGRGGREYYGLYGVERVGVASGRKYFGTLDWYKTGADIIINDQGADGGWGPIHDTCFATVFLCRGRAPVMMNKLLYETASKKQVDPWNERPRDVANLAKWTSKHALETFLNWQIVSLKVSVDDLHDAPILFISGSEELSLANQDIDKLRLFVEQGGMILGNADCGSRAFSESFKKLGAKLFPKYEFRRLQMNHPIFDEQYHGVKWKTVPVVEGLSNGVREMLLLIPEADLGRTWQTESLKIREEAFQLGGNIFLYATGKENLNRKGDTYIVNAEGAAGREIKVARLQLGDNWDPEPGAWRRLSAILHNTRHVDVKPEPVKLGEGTLANYKIADLTGTTRMVLSADQRTEIKAFVDKGGTLIVDAAGGSSAFADSIEGELKQIFGDAATTGLGEPLPADHALYTHPDFKPDVIKYRSFARQAMTGGAHVPRIRGITMTGGRIGVFYSREDLTAGAVGEPIDGVLGYDPKTATKLLSNLVMYADIGGKFPTTAPTTGPSTAPTTGPSTAPAANPVSAVPANPERVRKRPRMPKASE